MKECFKKKVINDKECKIIKCKNVFYILHRVWKTDFSGDSRTMASKVNRRHKNEQSDLISYIYMILNFDSKEKYRRVAGGNL